MKTKVVEIIIPNELVLNRIKSTPTFQRLSRLPLKIGKNIETVNHKQFYDMKRLFPIIGVHIEEIN